MPTRETINNFLFRLFGFEKTRPAGHVIVIILAHTLCWCLFLFLPVLLYPVHISDSRFFIREILDKLLLVIFFYINYYWLIPRFFEKKRYLVYGGITALALLCYVAQFVAIRASINPRGGSFQLIQYGSGRKGAKDMSMRGLLFGERRHHRGFISTFDSTGNVVFFRNGSVSADSLARFMPVPPDEPVLFGVPRGIWAMTINNAASSFALMFLIGGFIRLSYSFVRNQNEKKALENANLNAEVKFLKSQINPHFLFNTLNSIYSQAHSRSDHTEFSILKLSELLRYVLYDSGEERVDLAKDIQYIDNYIALQRLRLSPKVSLHYEVVADSTEQKTIAPLLLINFIENAFKHGVSYAHGSTINIDILIFEKTLTLTVSNPILEKDSFAPGGLGLKNVKRRLELLYPNRHQLDIHRQGDLHIINLKLDLTHA